MEDGGMSAEVEEMARVPVYSLYFWKAEVQREGVGWAGPI